jgi:hypothetical protein
MCVFGVFVHFIVDSVNSVPTNCVKGSFTQSLGRWVYALGVGDTYLAEYITIVFLSLYVYKTAIFDELIQVSLNPAPAILIIK